MWRVGCIGIVLLASLAHGLPAEAKAKTQVSTHIVGGEVTDIQIYPCAVSLQLLERHICGATLLNKHYALTAGHCIKAIQDLLVPLHLAKDDGCGVSICAGSTKVSECRRRYNADRIYKNPKYDDTVTVANDCGLVYFKKAIPEEGSTIRFCCITVRNNDPAPNDMVNTAGWGATQEGNSTLPDCLRSVTVPVVAKDQCNATYSTRDMTVHPSSFCAGSPGKDTCQGDSGGAVYFNGKVIGLTSWGYGCAQPGFPGVYARVGAPCCWDWITAKIVTTTGSLSVCKLLPILNRGTILAQSRKIDVKLPLNYNINF